MQTELYASLEKPPQRLQERVAQRTEEVLERFASRITRVRVFFRDEALPRGGMGTHCRLVLDPERGRTISAASLERDVDAALSKALRTARQRLRQRDHKRITRIRSGRRLRDAA